MVLAKRPLEQALTDVAGLHLGVGPLGPLSLPQLLNPQDELSPGPTGELDLPRSNEY